MRRSAQQCLWGIIGIFLALFIGLYCFDTYAYLRTHSPEAYCRATMVGFIYGINSYESEYLRPPLKSLESTIPGVIHRTRGTILKTLHPDFLPRDAPDMDNERKTNFYDPPQFRNSRGDAGYYLDEHHDPVLVDAWGEPYYFIIDLKGEGKVPNPDPRHNKAHPFIESSIIMFSAGPDRNPDTWEDNVMSWK